MLYIPLERSAKRTYTKQIYYAIRQKILSGELTAGEALPPYRELSQELGVAKNTVFAAYDMLVADGILRSAAGSGFYVEDGMTRRPPAQPVMPRQSAALSDRVIPDGVINFDNGQPALELFPRAKWNKAVSAAMLDIPADALGYDLPQGRPELRKALCEYLRKSQGLACDSENILITNGAKQAITLAAECLLNEKTEVWIEDPAPALLRQMLAYHTKRVVPFPVDGYLLPHTSSVSRCASVYVSAFCDSDDHDLLLLFLCRSSAAAFISFFWYLPHCGGARYGALHL